MIWQALVCEVEVAASTVDKHALVGRFHTSLCQYCDRQDVERHCHQHCQGPVTFALVV